ncbi:tetratricopeptide (TPR) repeat protein/transcriptional regulator with XRE-family HTH domain [Streptacidiphilus sp. MAP12-33]
MAEFGGLLREARLRSGFTQEELAERSGVSAHTINVLEAGHRRPRLSSVSRLAGALDLDEAGRARLLAAAARPSGDAERPSDGARQAQAPSWQTQPRDPQQDRAVCQLPPDTRLFTGRTAEVTQLLALGSPDRGADSARTVMISAVDGMGGIGKSALTVHVAHRLRPDFPDGQLFVDLQGHTPGTTPLLPVEALGQLLRSLGTAPEQIPQELAARAALYRDRLAGRRVLVLLDNATSTAQVRPLLPGGPGCLVLVTSRRRLTGLDDAHSLALDTLSDDEALALLREATGPGRAADAEDPDALRELVALCGHLPLALRISAARLRHRPVLSVADLVEELRDERHRLDRLEDEDRTVASVFDTSYGALPEPEQRLFRLLALIPGPDFDAASVANLLGTDLRGAERLLESLLDHHLLSQRVAQRYHFHDLVRLHARRLRRDAGRTHEDEAALERLLDHYQYTMRQANLRLPRSALFARAVTDVDADASAVPGVVVPLPDRAAALRWLRTERDNLVALLAAPGDDAPAPVFAPAPVSAPGREPARPDRTVALTSALAPFLQLDGAWAEAADLHAAAASAAREQGDARGEAAALGDLGRVRHALGEYPASIEAHRRALGLLTELGDRRGQAEARWDLGRSEYVTGNYVVSAELLERSLTGFQEIADRHGEAGVLNDLGRVRLLTGDYPEAAALQERAVAMYQESDDRHGEAAALRDLGRARYSNGDPDAGLDLLTRALDAHRSVGNRLGEASTLHDLGHLLHETGSFAAAVERYEQALVMFRDLGNRQGEANALWNLGRSRNRRGDYPAAVALFQQARVIYKAIGSRQGEAATLREEGHTLHLTGELVTSARLFAQSREIYRAIGNRPGEAVVLTRMGALAVDAEGPAAADAYYQEALLLARECRSPMEEAYALEGSARCAEATGDHPRALRELEQAATLYDRLGAPEAAAARALLATWSSASA